jgi:hypothetical protein
MQACRQSFGESIRYKCSGLTEITIDAIVDYETQTIDPNTGAVVVSNQPMIGVKDSDLPTRPGEGDTCFVRGVEYRVIDRVEDGQAGTRLRLQIA